MKNSKVIALALTLPLSNMLSAVVQAQDESFAEQPLGALAPLVLSKRDLEGVGAEGVPAYRVWFENGSWQGDLAEYTVTGGGGLSSSVSFEGPSPINTGSKTNWSAHENFAGSDEAPYDWTNRNIVTWNAAAKQQVPFTWSVSTIGEEYMRSIDATTDLDAGNSQILDYIRGDTSNDNPKGKGWRGRGSILGAIIHSTPVYVGAPRGSRTDDGYAVWAADPERADRNARVFVGANDGMLHAFDAATGQEAYAYIPSLVQAKLPLLKQRPYTHTYFVDGLLTVRDAYFDSGWHSVLVGGLGAGGKGYFALDVTDPDLDEDGGDDTDSKVLWETAVDADMGESYSQPVIAKLNDGKWYAIVGNGYNSVNGEAVLLILDIADGSVKRAIKTGISGNNGLSSATLLDTNSDGTVDFAYAGDLKGNMWKFDLRGDATKWDVFKWGDDADTGLLHPAANNQAITHAPEISTHPKGGFLIYFATGRLFNTDDQATTATQSMYGIWDSGDAPPAAHADQNLLAQTWDGDLDYVSPGPGDNQVIGVYAPDAGEVVWESDDDSLKQHGWKVDFPAGYRVITPIQLRAGRAKVTVTKPQVGGKPADNYIAEAYALDGGPNGSVIYDISGDAALSAADNFDRDPDDGTGANEIPMMWKTPNGIMSQVTIARLSNGFDTLFLNYLEPPYEDACLRNCENGFQGGHIDVDTWNSDKGWGKESTKHEHEYDKKTKRVYIDFLDLNVAAGPDKDPKGSTGHIDIDKLKTAIDPNEPFIVLVANADLSAGSTMQVGNKLWDVTEYQRQLHWALANWKPSAGGVPVDENNDSMVLTLKRISEMDDLIVDDTTLAATLSHSFDDRAIVSGGLHPTNTHCVKGDAYGDGHVESLTGVSDNPPLVGRWHNGALVTQVVKLSQFTKNPDGNYAIERVNVQTIADMRQPDNMMVSLPGGSQSVATGLFSKKDNSVDYSHVWQSTLFWHWNGDTIYKAYFGKEPPCYGQDGYEKAVAFVQANSATAAAGAVGIEVDDAALAALDAQFACLLEVDGEYGLAPPVKPAPPRGIIKEKDMNKKLEEINKKVREGKCAVTGQGSWTCDKDKEQQKVDKYVESAAYYANASELLQDYNEKLALYNAQAEDREAAEAQCDALTDDLDINPDALAELERIKELWELYRGFNTDSPVIGAPGDPLTMGGGTEGLGPTTGPSFRFGRMSWTDVSPD